MWFFIVEKNLNESNLSFCLESTNESRIQKLVNRTGLALVNKQLIGIMQLIQSKLRAWELPSLFLLLV